MENPLKYRSRLLPVAMLVIAGIALAVVMGSSGRQANALSGLAMENEQGLTYGIMADSIRSEEPFDLVAAVATNGKEGYVLSADLDQAVQNDVTNPEEAVAYMKNREDVGVAILSAELNSDNGASMLSDDRDVLSQLWSEIQQSGLEAALSKEASLMSNSAVQIDGETIGSIRVELNKALAVSIPVYEEDGQTIIGEFLVGSF